MRPQCTWSMSTVGLTAQEISFPIENPFLRGSHCHSMAQSKPTWSYPRELDNFYFTMESAHTDYSSRPQLKIPPQLSYERLKNSPGSQRLLPKKCRPSHVSLSCSVEPSTPSPSDDTQVVPSFERLSMCSSPLGRGSKPLPPTPLETDISLMQSMDSEVEFFPCTDDTCCLVAEHCSKPSPFRYGLSGRRSLRDCGQINYAYYDGPLGQQTPREPEAQSQGPLAQDVREQQAQQQQGTLACVRQQAQRKLRRSHSGPVGSFNKPSLLRLTCQKRIANGTDMPEVPPPVPPRTPKAGDLRRLSGEYIEEDKPPVVPPREPLSRGSFRNHSPKSLPTYQNGKMPPTQSFAPDPKYVSCQGLQRQNSEGSPRIRPVIKNNEKVSDTHYYLSYC
ncbi:ERBB receptor feedback inhibitor 1a isoform X1 [Takifugu rubripes]|uniref:ERBB receptor feedback inhibitor 1a isoform X1 n=2 Tax=Takifugu rubripes TaxID=31033 RepID=UPI000298BFCA|nr:ERBB receptor feedback inhibitor 1 isoform X1 [Takifugu rubripes]|eukprot:XP_003973452.1 PREDICTED: ERBB receptor feedback inhibitor 1 [Takifugu rubripes]